MALSRVGWWLAGEPRWLVWRDTAWPGPSAQRRYDALIACQRCQGAEGLGRSGERRLAALTSRGGETSSGPVVPRGETMRTARSGRDRTRRRAPVATVVPRLGEEGDGGACHLLQLKNVAGADGGVSLGDEPLALR